MSRIVNLLRPDLIRWSSSYPSVEADGFPDFETIQKLPSWQGWGFVDSLQLKGCIFAWPDRFNEGHLWLGGLWVAVNFRRAGWGQRLVREALAFADCEGYTVVKLWVDERNRGVRWFYRELDFHPTGRMRIRPGDPPYHLQQYAADLRQESSLPA
ncbi:MAG: GNAT family N-acetyltransferase [Candidatus Methylacidiphilales bacterium]